MLPPNSNSSTPRANLLGLATAVPDHVLPQDVVVDLARSVFAGQREDFDRISSIFENAGIAQRYSVAPIGWFLEPQGWPERTQAYIDGACRLYSRVVEAALTDAELEPDQIDTVVTVSTTGIATPSLEARLLPELGFRQNIRRVPVFGLGCAGGAAGLSLASRLAVAAPSERVLVVTVELCTLAFRLDDFSTKSIISAALFGDGAAAAIVSCRGAGLMEIEHCGEQTWPDTLDLMGWAVDPIGFRVILSAEVPAFAEQELCPAVEGFLSANGLSLAAVGHLVLHPGGAKVVAALEAGFGLQSGTLRREREVLKDFGNMSAPTVLFVLRRALDEGVRGRGLMGALGPGFSASMLTYQA